MEITTRPINTDEKVSFREAIMLGFGEDLNDEEFPPEWLDVIPLDRTVAAFDGDLIVGTLGGFPFNMTVPGGGQVPMAGTTIVTVAATHRRQGVLTAMMRDHLEDGVNRGEPLVGLWASESLIYGRYGFGVASENEGIEIDQTRVSVEGDAGSVRMVSVEDAAKILPSLYDVEQAQRPGMLTRTEQWWDRNLFFDPAARRSGFSAQRYLVHETDGQADGYAIFRQKSDWETGFPDGKVRVREAIANSPTAHTGIWRYLTSIDLYPRIVFWNLPIDDPLRWKVPDHRRIIRKRWDALYVRILDVVQALEARTYSADGKLRLSVDDPFMPDLGGSFELDVVDGRGSCRRVDDEHVDLALGTVELSSLYLGGGSARSLFLAGLVRGDVGLITQFGRMFHGDIAPWCEEVF